MVYPSRCNNRYCCKRCAAANKTKEEDERTTSTFNAWDANVLSRMDDFVSKEFPFVLTKKAAICKILVNRLADDLLEGKGFSATSKSLEKAYSTTYLKLFRSFVSLANRRVSQIKGVLGQNADVGQIPKFGSMGDPSGFNSSPPSAHYLRDIWHKWFYEIPVVQVRNMENTFWCTRILTVRTQGRTTVRVSKDDTIDTIV